MSHKLMICSASLFILTAFSGVNASAESLGSLTFRPKVSTTNCSGSIECINEDLRKNNVENNKGLAVSAPVAASAPATGGAGTHAPEPGDAGTEPSEPSTPTF